MANIIFMGIQGSGKGTQAKVISKELNIPHISTGDLMRNASGKLGEELKAVMDQGKLVSDELVMKILKERLKDPDCKSGFILDGVPRNLNQVNLLNSFTKIDKVVEIYLDDNVSIERISSRISCKKCGAVYNLSTNPPKKENICNRCESELYRRADDNPEAIKKRLDTYHKETEPILEKYKDILIKVDGNQEIDKIASEILEKIAK